MLRELFNLKGNLIPTVKVSCLNSQPLISSTLSLLAKPKNKRQVWEQMLRSLFMSEDQILTKNNISNIPPFLSKICDVNLDFNFKKTFQKYARFAFYLYLIKNVQQLSFFNLQAQDDVFQRRKTCSLRY